MILARALGPEARGEYATAVFYPRLLLFLGLLGTGYAITRRAARSTESPELLARAAFISGTATGLGCMLVAVLLAILALPPDKSSLMWLCALCALILPFEQMRLTMNAVDQGRGRFGRYNLTELVFTALFPTVFVILWVSGAANSTTAALATLPVAIAGLALRCWLSGEPRRLRPYRPPVRTLLREGRPYAVSAIVGDVFARLDQLLILWMASYVVQGNYMAAVPATGILLAAPDALAMFAFNRGAREHGKLGRKELLFGVLAVLLFQFACGAALYLAMAPLILFVFGSKFAGAIPLALALLPAQVFLGVAVVVDAYLRGAGRATIGIWARCAGAVVMVASASLPMMTAAGSRTVPFAAIAGHGLVAVALCAFLVIFGARTVAAAGDHGRTV
jgi:O-antigen/teichoic acid export membrane protein